MHQPGDWSNERANASARRSGVSAANYVLMTSIAEAGGIRRFYGPRRPASPEDKPIPADWPDAVEELIEGHSRELAQLQGVEGVVTCGGPREELVQAGKELDLLIVGSRGYGPIGRPG